VFGQKTLRILERDQIIEKLFPKISLILKIALYVYIMGGSTTVISNFLAEVANISSAFNIYNLLSSRHDRK